jgi:hypothetical protein
MILNGDMIRSMATMLKDVNLSTPALAESAGNNNDILVMKGMLPFLPTLIEAANREGVWENSTVINDADPYEDQTQRTSKRVAVPCDPAAPEDSMGRLGLLLRAMEGALVQRYQREVNPHAIVMSGSGFELLRYEEGEFFGEHVDAVRDHPELGHRRLSAVGFCNSDYEGGELVFPRQNITIKGEAGDFLLFPSGITHPHEVRPVTSGVRYSIVTWYR